MTTVQSPRVGDIAVTPSRGIIAAGIRLVTHCPEAAHALVYTGLVPGSQPGQTAIEADPHGARPANPHKYPRVTWLTGLSARLTGPQRDQIRIWCIAHLGTPYSWLDDAAIGMVDVFGWAPACLRARMRSDATLMCSQLCVEAYRAAGVDLFPGLPGGAVSPGDLWRANQHALQAAAA